MHTHYFLITSLQKAYHSVPWFPHPLYSIPILSLMIVINHFKRSNPFKDRFYRQRAPCQWCDHNHQLLSFSSSTYCVPCVHKWFRGHYRQMESTQPSVYFLVSGCIHRNPLKCFVCFFNLAPCFFSLVPTLSR